MKRNIQNKGITLIALVITIIIVIILATITINSVVGDNGLIKQSDIAKDQTTNLVESEKSDMNQIFQEYTNVSKEDAEITLPDINTETNKYYIYKKDLLATDVINVTNTANYSSSGVTINNGGINFYIYTSTFWYSYATVSYEFQSVFESLGYNSLRLNVYNNNQISSSKITLIDEEGREIESKEVSAETLGTEITQEVVFNNIPDKFRLQLTLTMYNSGPNESSGSRQGYSNIKTIEIFNDTEDEEGYYIYQENFLGIDVTDVTGTSNYQSSGYTLSPSGIGLYINGTGYWYSAATVTYCTQSVFESKGKNSIRLLIRNNDQIDSNKVSLLDENGEIIETKEITNSGGPTSRTIIFNNIPEKFKLQFVLNMFNSGPNQTSGVRQAYSYIQTIELFNE